MKKIALFFSVVSFVLFENCKPKEDVGCTDANALNFNASANVSDSTCTYEADKFVGNYVGNDIVTHDHNGIGVLVYNYYYPKQSFKIVRENAQSIRISNFGGCKIDIIANKNYLYNRFLGNKIELESISNCDITAIKAELKNDTLIYSYNKEIGVVISSLTGQRIKATGKGIAVRK